MPPAFDVLPVLLSLWSALKSSVSFPEGFVPFAAGFGARRWVSLVLEGQAEGVRKEWKGACMNEWHDDLLLTLRVQVLWNAHHAMEAVVRRCAAAALVFTMRRTCDKTVFIDSEVQRLSPLW